MPAPVPVVLIGGGQRGRESFGSYALRRPEEMRIVAIVEPNEARRNQLAEAHHIPSRHRFLNWEDWLDAPLLSDCAIISTPDNLHARVAVHAMHAGYNVLVDTPIAQQAVDCLHMTEAAQATGQRLFVMHGLRYTAFYRLLHDIVASGRLGQIMSYRQERTLAFWHTAHQFVRTPHPQPMDNYLLLLEGIHDFDLICWLLKEDIKTVSAMVSTRSFSLNSAPIYNIPARCLDNCPIETECPYSSPGIYLEKRFPGQPKKGYPHTALASGDESEAALTHALEQGPYGKCVYHKNMEIVDNQNILMRSEAGINISLAINGHSPQDGRRIEIDGTHGSLIAEFIGLESHITLRDHTNNKENKSNFPSAPYGNGSDHALLGNLVRTLRGETKSLTDSPEIINAHLLAFAVEEARKSESVVDFTRFKDNLLAETV
ncbi:MAG TPA: Gfo/Idh/MocA family oxidoreductase [Aggregatilineales bacterium]|nr:Gfo/Idh/MocA family oxidoreductase [Aggregatilineales bacterium]